MSFENAQIEFTFAPSFGPQRTNERMPHLYFNNRSNGEILCNRRNTFQNGSLDSGYLPTDLPTYLPTEVGRYQNVWLYKSSNANFVGTIIWLDLYSQGFAFGEKFKNDICHTIKITILELLDPADDVINTF